MQNILHLNEDAEAEQKSLERILLSYLDNCINIIDQLKNEINHQKEQNDKLKEQIHRHKDKINILKGEKKRPKFKPSKLDKLTTSKLNKCKNTQQKTCKKEKTANLEIHECKIVTPEVEVPKGSIFKGYKDFVVQDLIIKSHNTKYRLERWITPDKKILTVFWSNKTGNFIERELRSL